MENPDLADVYRQYIACLNDRRFSELSNFANDVIAYNGEQHTLQQYRELIEASTDASPDLCFDVQQLVTQGCWLAARIVFRCQPRGSFLGFEPNGRALIFSENVFYRFENGRIAEVWSVIDRAAIAAQL